MADMIVYDADFETIARDRPYMTRLADALRNQVMFQTYRREEEKRAIAMCSALAEALGRRCAAASQAAVGGPAPPQP